MVEVWYVNDGEFLLEIFDDQSMRRFKLIDDRSKKKEEREKERGKIDGCLFNDKESTKKTWLKKFEKQQKSAEPK